jgi:hypothetical protein
LRRVAFVLVLAVLAGCGNATPLPLDCLEIDRGTCSQRLADAIEALNGEIASYERARVRPGCSFQTGCPPAAAATSITVEFVPRDGGESTDVVFRGGEVRVYSPPPPG